MWSPFEKKKGKALPRKADDILKVAADQHKEALARLQLALDKLGPLQDAADLLGSSPRDA